MFSMLNFYPKMMGYSGGGGGGGGSGGGGGGAGSGGAGGAGGGTGGGSAVGTGVGGLKTDNICGEGGRNALNGSVFFNGGNDALAIPAGPDFAYGTGDFTIEAWIWKASRPATGETRAIYTQTVGGNNYFVFYITSNNQISIILGHSNEVTSTEKITVDAWNHVAVSRASGTVKVYVNGVATSGTSVTTDLNDTTRNPTIGNYTHSYGALPFYGFISNLRVCIGHAVYTTDFTPPTSPLTAHFTNSTDKTSLLCCQNSDNPLEENSIPVSGENLPKTITGYGGLQSVDDTELITNSGFTADISGWTASGVQWSHSSGALMHFGNGSTQRNIFQDVTTVIGNRYVFRVEASSAEANTAYWQIIGDSDIAGNNFIADNNNAAPLEYVFYFTADSTTTKIRFYSYDSSNSSNVRSYWYKASLKLAPQPEAPKVLPPFGTDDGVTFDGAIAMNSSAYMCFPTGRTEERGRGRGIFAGGARSPNLDIQVLNIAAGGIAQDFGDLLNTAQLCGSASSTTRMLIASGFISPGSSNVIEFITIANIASSTDFGDLTEARRRPQGLSNSTRGAFVGGQTPTAVNTIDYVTIATAGNAADFGDTNASSAAHGAAVASSTRGVYTIGGVPAYTNTIEFITIATTGNGQDFGDLTVDANRGYQDRGSICDTTRGIFSGGFTGSNVLSNTIEFITMATTGNSTNFGDLPVARRGGFGTSNSRLAIFAGGYTPGSFKNAIDQVTIQTTGNATDFGDLVFAIQESSGSSDSHGGL